MTDAGDGPAYRIAGAQQLKGRGLRIIGGKFDDTDSLECVRTGRMISAATKDGIMVLETVGCAKDIEDSPEFRKLVNDVRNEIVSPLVDLRPYLKGGGREKDDVCEPVGKLAVNSFLAKFLLLATTAMLFSASTMLMNEAKLLPD